MLAVSDLEANQDQANKHIDFLYPISLHTLHADSQSKIHLLGVIVPTLSGNRRLLLNSVDLIEHNDDHVNVSCLPPFIFLF